jgi:hypothetical protein
MADADSFGRLLGAHRKDGRIVPLIEQETRMQWESRSAVAEEFHKQLGDPSVDVRIFPITGPTAYYTGFLVVRYNGREWQFCITTKGPDDVPTHIAMMRRARARMEDKEASRPRGDLPDIPDWVKVNA